MTTLADRILEAARAEVGYTETSEFDRRRRIWRRNLTKFSREAGHPNGYAWCASFVAAILRRCQSTTPPQVLSASSRTMWAEAKRRGLAVPMRNVRPGDVVHMTRGPKGAWLGHVGFVEAVDGQTLVTIEGNTNGAGSATGGAVLRHRRPASAWNLGAWRPR